MKRVLVALGMVIGLVAYVWFVASPSHTPGNAGKASSTGSHPNGPVLMYGDSLLVQATPYLRSTDEVRAYGGTALCDWVDKIAHASTVEQPSVLVVEFVGNDLTPCMQGYTTPDQIRAKYEADMARLKNRVDAPILWVGPPAFRDRAPAALGLYSTEPRFVDAGQSVLAAGTYTDTLPCLPDEGWVQGCVNGRIRVRASDGAHFAKSGSGYSAGGRRFADAIDEAVRELD
ncbi:MAG TPA: hypothetical protein VKE97_00900 [Acidimicrobiia bacterium]|nr:hypothetical protein [Acidimicrobiia bacterium]